MAITLLGHQPIDFTYKENDPCENLSEMCLHYETADNPMFQIKNTDVNRMFVTIQGTGSTDFPETLIPNSMREISGEFYTYTVDFDGLGITEGCFVICVYESENLVTNGTFTSNLDGWTTNGSWEWDAGYAQYLTETGFGLLTQDILTIGGTYIIGFDIVEVDEEVGTVILSGAEGSPSYNTAESHVFTGEVTSTFLEFQPDTDEAAIDNVFVYSLNPNDATLISCSPCINVQETQPECLLLMTAENDNNALNFAWDGLILKARIDAKLAKVEYDEDTEDLDDSSGDHITTYFDGKKNRFLQIDPAPIFIHDFLFMCKGVDTFKIAGVEYSIVDKYPSIIWNKGEKEGTAELKVRKKNYKLNKTNCG
jgi:hypothetical protein